MIARLLRDRRLYATGLALLVTAVPGCTRLRRANAPARPQAAAVVDRTIFTDSALFRRTCTQADSGLTPRVGRCTPRDQGVRVR